MGLPKALTPALSRREREKEAKHFPLIPAHTQGIRHAIDVVEPGCDQCDLQDSLIIKSNRSQPLMILLRDARGIAGKLRDVIKHRPVLL
jgi:hypothetical protein